MTRHAGRSEGRLWLLGNRVEAPIDLSQHAHHLTCNQFVALLIAGEIEFGEGLTLAANVAELTADTKCARKVAHGADHFNYWSRVRNDLRVDQRVRRKFSRRLRG